MKRLYAALASALILAGLLPMAVSADRVSKGADHYVDTDAATDADGLLVTAGPTEPVAFAREVFRLLGVYEGAVLDAWYRLFHDSDPEAYAVLEAAAR